jgi:hypothetical protein
MAFCAALEHDPEKWIPVSRLREALARFFHLALCFGGRRQVGKKIMLKEDGPLRA